MRSLVALAAVAPLLTSAHRGCGGGEIMKRNLGGPIVNSRHELRQITDEASAAISTDPATECTYYTYTPVSNIKNNYPVPWVTAGADLVAGDTEASTLFASINASLNAKLPNVQVKGTGLHDGDWTGYTYNATDPDCWWTWRQCDTPAASTGLPSDLVTVPEPMTWGLGFDDGPNCSHNALYDQLAAANQKATMFFIGSNVEDWPLQALRAIDDGHQICVHTWSHQYMTSFNNQQAFAELYYSRKMIKDILGVTPLCWRPPYGDVDNRIRFIAESLNLTTIVWSDDTEDWKIGVPADNVTAQTVDSNYQGVIAGTKNGTYTTHGPIVLNHELTNDTMTLFLQNYPAIQAAFQHVVPICTAMNWTQPYVESNYTCPDFATYISGTTNTSTTTTNQGGATDQTPGGLGKSSSSSSSSPSGSASGSASGASGSASASSSSKPSGAASHRANIGVSGLWAAVGLVAGVAGGMVVLA